MRLPRFRARTLMLLVAGAAVLLSTAITAMRINEAQEQRRKARHYRWMAGLFEGEEADYRGLLQNNEDLYGKLKSYNKDNIGKFQERYKYNPLKSTKQSISDYRARADYLAGLKRKYLRAASRPWEPVLPDPPPPPIRTNPSR